MDIDSPATPSMAITPVLAGDNDETPIYVEQPNKRRRKSIVWEHFTIETVGTGCMRACCKQCNKSFAYITGSKLAGTSHLKRHIALGICPASRQNNEASQFVSGVKSEPPPKRRYRTSPALGIVPFNQDQCYQDVAKMIIQHEYPLHMVEHPAFINFVRTLQPHYNMASLNTIQGEIVALYLREKQGLLSLISGLPGRVSISLDLRLSNLNVGYAFLTGHFIDNDWKLHHHIFNVVMLPFPESEYAFNQAVVSCISDWHLESRLFTLTLDQSVSNDNIIGNLRGLLSVKKQLMFNGQLVKGNCYARVLSRLAHDALGATDEVVRRIRESVKYVKTSDSHDEKFAELKQRLQVPSTRDLIIDDQTKWDTTYHMLVAACELKEVFACLDTTDPVYKINPSIDDWKQVEILCTYLKLLYDAASILTGPMYPPASAFYHEASKIQLELTHAAMGQDLFVSNLARPLKEKFDQYWRDCFLVLAIAIVMDPRFKMKLVEFSFSRIFGEDAGMWIKIVDDGIHELFLDYVAPNLSAATTYMDAGNTSISQSDIFPEAHHEEVASQEASFQELQAMHHEDVAAQELYTQAVAIQELHPEVTPEVQPKEDLLQDPYSKVMNYHEVAQQEKATEEAPWQETHELLQENSQEITKEMNSQSLAAQEVVNHVEATQEMDSQEATQEMNSQTEPQEMDSREVSVKEMESQEAVALQLVFQDVTIEEMQNAEVIQVQGTIEEMQAHEKETPQMQDWNADMNAQDAPVKPTEDRHAQELISENICAQGVHASQFQTPNGHTEEMQPAEGQVEEMKPAGEKVEEFKLAEENIEEFKPTEEQAVELKPNEEQAEELKPLEEKTGELKPPEEQSEELKPVQKLTEEMKSAEQTKEMPQPSEVQTEEIQPAEVQTREMTSPESESHELHPSEGKTQEMHSPEAQTTQGMHHPPAEESQEMHLQDAQTREMHLSEEQAQEIPHSEKEIDQLHSEEAHTNETQLQEAQNREMQPQQLPSQDMLFQEVQYHQAMYNQEMHSQGIEYEALSHEMHAQDLPLLSIGDGLQDFEVYISEIANSQHLKSELDQYLEESLLPRVQDFDVLGWWKLNKLKYPTLSKMAADILSIPVSTVAPHSVFDITGRKIDTYQSSLPPVTLEALVCAKNWLQSGASPSSSDTSNALVKMEH